MAGARFRMRLKYGRNENTRQNHQDPDQMQLHVVHSTNHRLRIMLARGRPFGKTACPRCPRLGP
ncbi:MAG: hypothetical protein Kow0020_14590 [Wenzhouxiangellaceae bacterium]